jgi:O-antigen/teichoic acid export membrane protein
MTSIAPLISRAKTLGESCFENTIRAYYKLMGCFGWGFVVAVALVADRVIRWLYGAAYAESGPLLALLGMRFLLICFSIARSQFIVNQNVLWIYPITTITGAVINVGLNFVLIPRYGAIGAIYASLVSLSVTIFGMDPLWRTTRRNFRLMMRGLLMPWSLRLAEFHLPESVGENSAAETAANGQRIGINMLPGARAPAQND